MKIPGYPHPDSVDARASALAIRFALTVVAIGAAAIAGAWFFQLVLGILPCPLCLEQRYAYYIVIPLALVLALGAARMPRFALATGFLIIALAMLINAGLGSYHAGVEWGWWQGPTACSGGAGDFGSASNLLERLDTSSVIRCDAIPWQLFGLSLAGYNALVSLLMALIAGWASARLMAKTR